MPGLDIIYQNIVNTIKYDYVGFEEKKELHDSRFFVHTIGTAFKMGKLDNLLFYRTVSQYLACLGDRNVRFDMAAHNDYQPHCIGFRTRRYGEDLFVTETKKESRLAIGDRITHINSKTPGEQKRRFAKNFLYGNEAERELWDGVLKMAGHLQVLHKDGTVEQLTVNSYPLPYQNYTNQYSEIKPDILYMRLEHFTDPEEMGTILKQNQDLVSRITGLILDLRKNIGGIDRAYFHLLGLISDSQTTLAKWTNNQEIYTNYTQNNVKYRVDDLKQLKSQADVDIAEFIDEIIQEEEKNAGKNLILETIENDENIDFAIVPPKNLQKVVIISDTFCEGIAEEFIETARKSSKVTVIGRPTMGNLDYCNLVKYPLNEIFTLTYPISKRKEVLEGYRLSGKGVAVDLYIPFTPQECEHDLLLEKALELF